MKRSAPFAASLAMTWISLVLGVLAPPASAAERTTYEVKVEENVMVEMRDGVKLAIDLYIPMQNGQPLTQAVPAVLQRTPYNKAGLKNQAIYFARQGYLSAIQDCRGRFQSEGEFFPFIDDPKDGYDTIEWLAKRTGCNGRVGMYGCSYMAWVQFQAATQNPPSLKTIIPYEGPINAYHYSMRNGGALHLGLLRWVLDVARTGQEAGRDPAGAAGVQEMLAGNNFLEWATKIPWQRGETPLKFAPRYEDAAFKLYFDEHNYNDFWRQPGLGMSEYFERYPKMPILWVVGWYDWYPRTISDGYQKMVALGRENQHILIGPWTHNNFNASCGDVNFGIAGAQVRNYEEYLAVELAWFDRWLKEDASVELGQPVKFFLMGGGDGRRGDGGRLNHGGRWLTSDTWPPKSSVATRFYLHPKSLSTQVPAEEQASTSYRYDPDHTVSSNGRCIIAYGPAAKFGFSGMGPRDQIDLETLPGHGVPGQKIADRKDVVVFQTAALEKDVTIAGDVKADLWVSSDAPDTDFFVKLLDVYPPSADYPQGYALPVSEGILRARFREGFEKPVLMEAGQAYRLEIPLEPAANVFRAGHSIRIDICSSNFPNFDINRNTGDPNDRTKRIATNTILHNREHASAIVLPVFDSAAK